MSEDLAEKIYERIVEVILEEVGEEKKILRLEPTVIVIKRGDELSVDISVELELSPFVKKSREEILERVREEVDKLVQELTGKKPIDRGVFTSMIDELLAKARERGLIVEIEEDVESIEDALRAFAINVDIKKALEIVKEYPGPGLEEILEELDVDTCEADFVYFFLEELVNDEAREIFEELKKRSKEEAVIGTALRLLVSKSLGKI